MVFAIISLEFAGIVEHNWHNWQTSTLFVGGFFTNSQEVQDLKILDTVAAASCNMDAYHHIITIHGSTYTAK